VRDARYFDNPAHFCSQEAHGEIQSPNPIRVEVSLKNPSCNAYSDGKIELKVSGGRMPYTYLWSDGATTKDRNSLSDGDYRITITDANNCFMSETYELRQPEALAVNIGSDFTLCANRSETLNGSLSLAGMHYNWTKDGVAIAADSLCTIRSAGVYRLTVSNESGCSAFSEIKVSLSDEELVADFVVASKIPNNTRVYAVNIIRTGYDRIEWSVPKEAIITEELSDRLQFAIPANGRYRLGMIAYRGNCRDILYKDFEVANKNEIEDYNEAEPLLKRFVVYPNPNNGHFAVYVELSVPTDYSLVLYNSQGIPVETKTYTNSMGGEIGFTDSTIQGGVYYLRFISEKVTSLFKIIVQQ
jgi:hypothetical protein